jgi:hypothetical protein
MLNSLTLKGKILVLESISLVMFLTMAIFALIQLSAMISDMKIDSARFNEEVWIMNKIGSMEVHFLKEVKLAKDVWLRGADQEKLKKYRGEFITQQELFVKDQADALMALKKLAAGSKALDEFINEIVALDAEHQAVTSKYLAQIDAHTHYADSDAKVNGIDRAVSAKIIELRENIIKFVNAEGVENVVQADCCGLIYTDTSIGAIFT